MARAIPSLLLAATLTALAQAPVQAQASGFLPALGYAAVGATAGAYATRNVTCDSPEFICIPGEAVAATLGGLVIGAAVGAAISSSANRSVERGQPIGGAHLAVLSVGTVLGGAAVGLGVGAALADRFAENGGLGLVTASAAAGAMWGIVRLHQDWGQLTGTAVDVRPAVLEGGRPGLVAGVRF